MQSKCEHTNKSKTGIAHCGPTFQTCKSCSTSCITRTFKYERPWNLLLVKIFILWKKKNLRSVYTGEAQCYLENLDDKKYYFALLLVKSCKLCWATFEMTVSLLWLVCQSPFVGIKKSQLHKNNQSVQTINKEHSTLSMQGSCRGGHMGIGGMHQHIRWPGSGANQTVQKSTAPFSQSTTFIQFPPGPICSEMWHLAVTYK